MAIRSIEDLVVGKKYRVYYEQNDTLERRQGKFIGIGSGGRSMGMTINFQNHKREDFVVIWKAVKRVEAL